MMVNARTRRNGAGTRTDGWVLGIALVVVAGLGTIVIGQADSVLLSVQLPDRPTAHGLRVALRGRPGTEHPEAA